MKIVAFVGMPGSGKTVAADVARKLKFPVMRLGDLTDEELKAEIDKIQDAKVKAQFEAQEPRLHLRHALRQTRTLDLLKKMVGG